MNSDYEEPRAEQVQERPRDVSTRHDRQRSDKKAERQRKEEKRKSRLLKDAAGHRRVLTAVRRDLNRNK